MSELTHDEQIADTAWFRAVRAMEARTLSYEVMEGLYTYLLAQPDLWFDLPAEEQAERIEWLTNRYLAPDEFITLFSRSRNLPFPIFDLLQSQGETP